MTKLSDMFKASVTVEDALGDERLHNAAKAMLAMADRLVAAERVVDQAKLLDDDQVSEEMAIALANHAKVVKREAE